MKSHYVIIILSLLMFFSCDLEIYLDTDPNSTTTTTIRRTYTTTTTTIRDPNESAHLDIIDRYDAPAGTFANWQNGHVYIISDDDIKIVDLSDDATGDASSDRIKIVQEIPFSLADLSGNWTSIKGCGIADLGTKILMLADLSNDESKITTLLSIRHDGSDFMLSDLTKDLVTTTPIYSIYYDNVSKIFSSIHNGDSGSIFVESIYDETNDKLKLKSKMPCDAYHIINVYYYSLYWREYPLGTLNIIDKMDKPYGSTLRCDWANLEYLGMYNPIISAFYDGVSFYLYINEDKPEYLKVSFRPR
ncbi:MAG: hypothetical protein IKQ61_01045 [Spirochaetales bacterium]|nr:hypothetical protein [Spirochaetales bacterium]